MTSSKRNLLILAALLAAWGLMLAFRSPGRTPVTSQPHGRVAAPRAPAAQGGGLTRLKTELLSLPLPAYSPEGQSLFGSPPPPPRPAGASGTAAGAPPPPDPFQEEAKRLRYVGFLQTGDAALAFIVQGPEVHTVAAGAMLGERFRVEAVAEDAVLLSSPTGDKHVRLPLAPDAGSAAVPKR